MSLTNAGEIGPYFRCSYQSLSTSSSTGDCYYYSTSYTLTELPNTPPGSSSNLASCPTVLPDADSVGDFYWKVPSTSGGLGNCVTMVGAPDTLANGTHITIQPCGSGTGAYPYDGQYWRFNGNTIQQRGMCVDVTSGTNADGTKLQAWTCFSGNTNQQFNNVGGDLLYYPSARFTWVGKGKCIDLTGGSTTAGNQLQVWTCNSANTNQGWTLEVPYPE
ncbi:ricin B lectin domain-containing protein [Flagelloscypha sp. PMI_526]|nr:ricin B lectin domain-containing protein [Flagelloscypha sp. PMI_526]